MITRPMLADTIVDLETLQFPIVCSPKLDGIRCLKINGKALTRKFKPIPNNYIRTIIEKNYPDGIDGEIMIEGCSFNEIQSAVMREAGEPKFTFNAFDLVTYELTEPFNERLENLRALGPLPKLVIVPQFVVESLDQLKKLEQTYLAKGYEGVMIRDPSGPYKCGRSTLNEGYLLKLKRFNDSEARVIGFVELQHNINAKEINELGLSKRSTKKEGKVGADTLGKFLVRDIKTDIEFEVGTGEGLTQELRKKIWDNRNEYYGKIIKYKYQACGVKDKPRFPVWLGFRSEIDL